MGVGWVGEAVHVQTNVCYQECIIRMCYTVNTLLVLSMLLVMLCCLSEIVNYHCTAHWHVHVRSCIYTSH